MRWYVNIFDENVHTKIPVCSHVLLAVPISAFEPELFSNMHIESLATQEFYGRLGRQAGAGRWIAVMEVGIRCGIFLHETFLNLVYLYLFMCMIVCVMWFGSELAEMLHCMSYIIDDSSYLSFSIRLNLWNVPSNEQSAWSFVAIIKVIKVSPQESPKRYAPDLAFFYLLHDHSERRHQIILGMSSAITSNYIHTMCFVWISRSVNFPDFQLSVFELFVIVNLWGHHRLCMEGRGQRRWSGHQGVVVVVVVVVWSLWLCEDILLLDCLRFNFHGCLCVCLGVLFFKGHMLVL